MSDTGDDLEDELRALLSRVLSGQLEGVTGEVRELAGSVGKLFKICKDLATLPKKLGDLVAAQDALAERLQCSVAKEAGTLAQQVERLHGALAETCAAVSARAKEVQQDLVDSREALATQSNAQAEALAGIVTRQTDALGLALNAVQQRVEERSSALDKATVRLAQAVEETNTLMQSRLSELKRKIGLLTGLSIMTIIVLAAAVISAGAIFLGAVAGRFGS